MSASATVAATISTTLQPAPEPLSSDTLTDASVVPSLARIWTCCAQAAIQAAVLAKPLVAAQKSGRSVLQESFWRHQHPQLRARSSAVHTAVDWLYSAVAAISGVEQAVLQPSSAFVYTSSVDAQVCLKVMSYGASLPAKAGLCTWCMLLLVSGMHCVLSLPMFGGITVLCNMLSALTILDSSRLTHCSASAARGLTCSLVLYPCSA